MIRSKLSDVKRREFMGFMAGLGIARGAAPWAATLAGIGEAAAANSSTDDYKALVCVFLYGGNDHGNTVIPFDTPSYNSYAATRLGLAVPRERLGAEALTSSMSNKSFGARQVVMAPELIKFKELWKQKKLGIQLGIGPLEQPTTLQQYFSKSVPLPPKLFSHNDQQSLWQASNPEGATSGWGGRLGDLFLDSNAAGATFTCVNTSGNAVFVSGKNSIQYQISGRGAVQINSLRSAFDSGECGDLLRELITSSSANAMEDLHSQVVRRSIDASVQLGAALSSIQAPSVEFSNEGIEAQLNMVARMIAARGNIGVKRQVFFVSMSGFDLHNDLLDFHPGLLSSLDSALSKFYTATEKMGVSNQVTTFTASDFGRTMRSNGDGSDHGWGGHHFVLGGAVRGGQFWGDLPSPDLNGPDDVGQGRLLPSTSVDQQAATLASWMGVSASEIPTVVPRIGAYTQKYLNYF